MCLAILSMEHVAPPNTAEEVPVDLLATNTSLVFDFPFDILLEQKEFNESFLSGIEDASSSTSSPLKRFFDFSNYRVLEPLDKDVVLQVIEKHSKTHPYLQIYHQKITNSLVVAMHSGYSREVSKSNWQRHVHSKVGFSNFLSYIADRVGDIVEAAAKEDAKIKNEAEETLQEHDEASLKEKQEASVGTPLPESKASSAKSGSKKSNNSSAKTKPNSTVIVDSNPEKIPLPSFEERKLFTGYDVGDQVLLCNGTHANAFTMDGVKITTEHTQFTHKPASLIVSMIHNDVSLSASFSLNSEIMTVLPIASSQDPNSDALIEEGSDESNLVNCSPITQPPASILFGAFKGQCGKNLTFAFSQYGSNGNGVLPVYPKSESELQKLQQSQIPDSAQSSRPTSQDKKASKKQQEEQQRLLEQQALESKNKEILLQKVLSEKKILYSGNMHQKLCVTTSNDLCITFSTMVHSIPDEIESTVVRQYYPTSVPPSLATEVSRVYFDDGCVLKTMSNGCLCILCHDGKIYNSVPSSMKSTTKDHTSDSGNRVSFHNVQDVIDLDTWLVTFPDGKREIIKSKEHENKGENVENDSIQNSPSDSFCRTLESLRTYVVIDPKTKDVSFICTLYVISLITFLSIGTYDKRR